MKKYNIENVTLDIILDYAFGHLSDAKEEALEHFFDTNAIYADIVEAVMSFCVENELKTKKEAP